MAAAKPPPVWLFALTGMPYGVVGAFSTVVMGYLTRRAGVEVGDIGWFVMLVFIPPMLQFLYAPIVDFGPKRKHWLLIVTVIGAVLMNLAFVTPLPDDMTRFLVLVIGAQLVSGLVGSCNGGLMASAVPDNKRGRAGAWYNIGNLSGGGISAALAVYLLGEGWSAASVGLIMSAMMIVPALAVLAIEEPPREPSGTLGEALKDTLRGVRGVLFSRTGLTALLLCMSPVGTAALGNAFSAIAFDYVTHEVAAANAGLVPFDAAFELFLLPPETAMKMAIDERSGEMVAFVLGPLGQVLTAVGALAGGWLCDRYNRRAMYLTAGLLTAVIGVVMALSPPSEATFTWGAITYMLVTGFCYAAFTATVLDTIGTVEGKVASTQYSLFVAGGNVAIAYVVFVDTRFHESHGVEGVVFSDAALNFGGVIVLALVFWKLGLFRKRPA
jgi:MFS transporter, PAT family, beta-lactamase induction signal transducer AmpG